MPVFLIFVLIIIFSSVASRKNTAKQQHRTGTFMPPVGGKKPGHVMRDEAVIKPAEPVLHPPKAVVKPETPAMMQTSLPDPLPKTEPVSMEGHSAPKPDQYAQGDSRECEHGAVGGSMEVTQHEGSPEPIAPIRRTGAGKQSASSANAMVREMQRAVIMAEILQRPVPGKRRCAGR